MDKKIISRAYIIMENGKEYVLHYMLITEPKKDYAYGVEIYMSSDNNVNCETCYEVSNNLTDTLHFINLLAQNFVMPITLPYIVEDYAPCKR